MSTDIKLEDNHVVVEAWTLKVAGWDLVLDGGDARRPTDKDPSHLRRALVHDFNDGLTLNYAGDYPAGVAIRGDVNISEKLIVPCKEWVPGTGTQPGRFETQPADVGALLSELRTQVKDLSSQVADLQLKSTVIAEANHYSQNGWRWCRKCSGLHYAPNRMRSVCQADGRPHAVEPGDGSYTLFVKKSRYGGQTGWEWCYKCQLLGHGTGPFSGSCPAGDQHDRSRSLGYLLWHPGATGDATDFPTQSNWRWCNCCYGLFHGDTGGSCAASGGEPHNFGGSYDYHLQVS